MKTEEKSPVEKVLEAARLMIAAGPVEPALQGMLDSSVRWLGEALANPESFNNLREARESILFVARASPKLSGPEWEERRFMLEKAAALLPDIGGSLATILRAHDALDLLHLALIGPQREHGGAWVDETVAKAKGLLGEVARLAAIIDSVSDTNIVVGKNAKLVALPGIARPGGKTLVPVDPKLRIGVVFAGGWHACSGPLAQVLNLESWATQLDESHLMNVVAQRIAELWNAGNATVTRLFMEEE